MSRIRTTYKDKLNAQFLLTLPAEAADSSLNSYCLHYSPIHALCIDDIEYGKSFLLHPYSFSAFVGYHDRKLFIQLWRILGWESAIEGYTQSIQTHRTQFRSECIDMAKSFHTLGEYELAMLSLESFLPDAPANSEECAHLHHEVASCANDLYLHNKALSHQKTAYAIAQAIFDRTDHRLAALYSAMSSTHLEMGDVDTSVEWEKLALAIYKHHEDSENILRAYDGLATLHLHEGQTEDCWHYIELSEKIIEQDGLEGSLHECSLLRLKSSLLMDDNLDQALECMMLVENIIRPIYPSFHPMYLDVLHQKALIYDLMGSFSEALSIYLQTFEIRKSHFGLIHPEVAGNLGDIGSIYMQQGNFTEALQIFDKVIETDHLIAEKYADFEGFVDVARAYKGQCLREMGNIDASISCLRDAQNESVYALEDCTFINEQLISSLHQKQDWNALIDLVELLSEEDCVKQSDKIARAYEEQGKLDLAHYWKNTVHLRPKD